MKKKLISIVTPCYNEEENVLELYTQVKRIRDYLSNYNFEHIFIDNASKDNTAKILKVIARKDKAVKIIFNTRNFGVLRSPIHALYQAKGDAIILLVSDLQEPPELMAEFIKKWEEGFKVVVAVKTQSEENRLMFLVRKTYYYLLDKISETSPIKNFNGYALYDRVFIESLRKLNDPYPYLRGLVTEFGYSTAKVPYTQLKRKNGRTKGNFYILYDVAMLGIINNSKLPLRLASFIGLGTCLVSIFHGGFLLFVCGVQLFFLGIIGEYIGCIHTKITNMPLVIERERVNF